MKKLGWWVILAALAPAAVAEDVARLERLLDGATLEVEYLGRRRQVRFIGVEAAPNDPCLLDDLQAFAASMVGEAELERDAGVPERGRLLVRYVEANRRDLGGEALRRGLGRAIDGPYNRAAKYLDAQRAAEADGVGLWKDACADLRERLWPTHRLVEGAARALADLQAENADRKRVHAGSSDGAVAIHLTVNRCEVDSSGRWTVEGVVENVGRVTVDFVLIRIDWLAEGGRALTQGWAEPVSNEALAPGDTARFRSSIEHPGVASCSAGIVTYREVVAAVD